MTRLVKKVIDRITYPLGFEIKRVALNQNKTVKLPPIFDDPLEALPYAQRQKRVAFECPINLTIKPNFLTYGSNGFHPFVETLVEYGKGKADCYEDSVLKVFYDNHQPKNAFEAMLGFDNCPDQYKDYPSYLYRLTPWEVKTPAKVMKIVRNFTREHNLDNNKKNMTLETDGYQYHGPVSMEKGQLEFERLTRIYKRLKKNGYDRKMGHANFLVLKRGKDVRFLSHGPGNHRTAAMSALGYETIPGIFYEPSIIDIQMIEYWPQVKNGLWSIKQATDYFDHVFEFDSRKWAINKGFLINNRRD